MRIRVYGERAEGSGATDETVRPGKRNGHGGTAVRHLTLDVEDTGPGFPAGAETQAFERFFTTKPAGRGTGLGLWIVRETVAAFGGTASADRGAEGGAVVRLSLPVADAVG